MKKKKKKQSLRMAYHVMMHIDKDISKFYQQQQHS